MAISMALTVDTAYAPELLIYRISEWPSRREHEAVRNRLTADGLLKPHSSALIDFRTVVSLPDSVDVARMMTDTTERRSGPARLAYVVSSEAQERFVYSLSDLAPRSLMISAFWNEHDAVAWLFPKVKFPLSFLP